MSFSLVDGEGSLFTPCSPRIALENSPKYHVSLSLAAILNPQL